MSETKIELHLGRVAGSLFIFFALVAVVVFVIAAASVGYGEAISAAILLALFLGITSLLAQLWLLKIVLGAITITTVPHSQAEAADAKASAMPPKPASGAKLDARKN